MATVSLQDSEFMNEVRNALAGMDTAKIPDETITQAKERFVVPLLNEVTGDEPDQDAFDNAAIAWTAEKAFDAWMVYHRIRDAELESYVRPNRYREKLVERTDNALYVVGATRPPQTPNEVVTVKHDGEKRRVDLDQEWVPES